MNNTDQSQRQRALNPTESFIVQAPAGSGKTHLLTQRFLRLLTTVEQPEAILAITFTRKAAAEMRERIMTALTLAANHDTPPATAHDQLTWRLANAALAHDQAKQWDLHHNPARLQIMTIDAFCARLTQHAPQLSRLYHRQQIDEQPAKLYQRAISNTLTELDQIPPFSDAIAILLEHLDNRVDIVSQLLTAMLARREQWLDIIVGLQDSAQQRAALEINLQHVVTNALIHADKLMPTDLYPEMQRLYRFACNHHTALTPLANQWPTPTLDNVAIWQSIASFVLTKQGQWRKQVDKRYGFPAATAGNDPAEKALFRSNKQDMLALLTKLMQHNELQDALHAIMLSPTPYYTDQQWAVLSALLTLLPVVAAQLQLVFADTGCVDFSEISLGALYALHDHQGPTDLALHLDYQLHHVLVDEFQDTSITQFRLLTALTSGWQSSDSNTLFLVGDPMQSIYRFRQADVSLFLHAKQHEIGAVSLTYLALSDNFRSQPVIIDWLNQYFTQLFPTDENLHTGAIPYSPATATTTAIDTETVTTHLVIKKDDNDQQTTHLIKLVTQTLQQSPDADIAILVRSRAQLTPLLSALRDANIVFSAVDIERLHSQCLIQDLVNLTYAICFLADRTAWLSLLRTPFCGFDLKLLTELVSNTDAKANERLIWDCLQQAPTHIQQQPRFQHVYTVLQHWWQTRHQQPLHTTVFGIWYALGGPACYTTPNALAQADAFFTLLSAHDVGGTLADRDVFAAALDDLYAPTDNHDHCKLHIMTLHKAKGLEFDVVILPYLDKTPPAPEQPLLRWQRIPDLTDGLLLAPIKALHAADDPIYRYLQQYEKQHTKHEVIRLLYVGATRAKQQLHLMGSVQQHAETKQLIPAKSHSLLGMLWDQLDKNKLINIDKPTTVNNQQQLNQLSRLTDDWYASDIAQQLKPTIADSTHTTSNTVHTVSSQSIFDRAVGIIIHRCLERIAIEGLVHWQQFTLSDYHAYWQQQLLHLSLSTSVCQQAIAIIEEAIQKTLTDQRGQWILSAHPLATNELRLTTCIDDKPQSVILDRTFVDGDRCWIIDYKTAVPEKTLSNDWLVQQKQLYAEQLQRYANALAPLRKQPIQIGLYFPRIGGWIEWQPEVLSQRTIAYPA